MPPKKTFAGSFRVAGRGIAVAAGGRNFRIHLCAAIYVIWFAILGELWGARLAALLICCALVLCTEAVNTAMELLCDLYSTEYNRLIAKIKDVAAGATLISAVFSVIVGAVIFLDGEVLENIWRNIVENPFWTVALALTVPVALIFILKTKKTK